MMVQVANNIRRVLRSTLFAVAIIVGCGVRGNLLAADSQANRISGSWPPIQFISKPWTYWYWMGGAVDELGITHHLEQYREAGLGGVHIIPVYGVRGAEKQYVDFLSRRWME